MATNGQILAKFLRGETLLPSEIGQLERALGEYDRAKTFTYSLQNGTGRLRVDEIEARSGYFEQFPSYVFRVARTTAQSINNNTETVISMNYNDEANRQFHFDSDKVYAIHPYKIIAVMGTIQWASNATGRRGVHLNWYNAAGGLEDGKTMHSMKPTGVDVDTFPFVSVFDFSNTPNGRYFQFTCIQTSGGALNMEYFRAAIYLLK